MSKRRERAKQRRQKQKRQQMLLAGGGVAVALVLAVVVIFLVQDQAEVDVCDASDEDCYGTYIGLEQGLTDEGIPYIGSLDAQIVVTEFSDFSCPHCATFHSSVKRIIEDFVRTGQIRFEYRLMEFVNPPYSTTAANAALCAAEQEAFWQLHDEIFEVQRSEGSGAFDDGLFEDMIEEMGLDTDEYNQCINSNRPRVGRLSAQDLYRQLDLGGTPSLAVSTNGGRTWTPIQTSYNAVSNVVQSVNTAN